MMWSFLQSAIKKSATIAIQFDEPNAAILAQLGRELAGSLFLVPKEAAHDSQLDLNAATIGTGPWYVDEWQPSLRWKLKKNPGFGQDPRGLPFIDEVDFALIQEYAAYLVSSALAPFTRSPSARGRSPDRLYPPRRRIGFHPRSFMAVATMAFAKELRTTSPAAYDFWNGPHRRGNWL
jgi:Bacterial extracellular solute-binding proteins, family 5 Middle